MSFGDIFLTNQTRLSLYCRMSLSKHSSQMVLNSDHWITDVTVSSEYQPRPLAAIVFDGSNLLKLVL